MFVPKEEIKVSTKPGFFRVDIFLNAFGHSALPDIGKINRPTYKASALYSASAYFYGPYEKHICIRGRTYRKDPPTIRIFVFLFFYSDVVRSARLFFVPVLDVVYKLKVNSNCIAPGWLGSTRSSVILTSPIFWRKKSLSRTVLFFHWTRIVTRATCNKKKAIEIYRPTKQLLPAERALLLALQRSGGATLKEPAFLHESFQPTRMVIALK